MKSYELPLTRNYVENWGVREAIREFIQNALDSDSPFEYHYDRQLETLSITSQFAKLDKSTLLLGSTSKSDDPTKIGNFGEGYKIAMLVLTRTNHKVQVFNDGVVWEPVFKESRQFGAATLHVNERRAQRGEPATGVTFRVHDIFQGDYNQLRLNCLQMQTPTEIGEFITTPYGQILKGRPGHVFVGGLLINVQSNLKYGYNFDPEQVKLERDRQTVDGWDLYNATCKLWYSVAEKHMANILEMIEEGVADMAYAQYNSNEIVKEAAGSYFLSKHPEGVPVSSREELEKHIQRGFTNVVYVNSNMGHLLGTNEVIADRIETQLKQPAPLETLKAFFENKDSHWTDTDKSAWEQIMNKAQFWKV